jgi:hypothetical protein
MLEIYLTQTLDRLLFLLFFFSSSSSSSLCHALSLDQFSLTVWCDGEKREGEIKKKEKERKMGERECA